MPEIDWPDLRVHPAAILDEEDLAIVALWSAWRGRAFLMMVPAGGAGAAPIEAGRMPGALPFSGGAAEQPAFLMDAFAIMEGAAQKLKPGAASHD